MPTPPCPLCGGTLVLEPDSPNEAPCPFHANATLVGAELTPEVSERIRANVMRHVEAQRAAEARGLDERVFGPRVVTTPTPGSGGVDWRTQHQLEPAGLTTPNRFEIVGPPRRTPSRHHWGWRALGALIPAVCAGLVAFVILLWIKDVFS